MPAKSPAFDYAPAPESRAIVTLDSSYGLFINGEFTRPKATFASINPADETVLAEVSQASTKDVDKAVAAARAAYTNVWSKLSGAERGKYLFHIARILQSAPASSRSWRRSTTASRSRRPAMSMCPSLPRTSSTTRGGLTSSSMPA